MATLREWTSNRLQAQLDTLLGVGLLTVLGLLWRVLRTAPRVALVLYWFGALLAVILFVRLVYRRADKRARQRLPALINNTQATTLGNDAVARLLDWHERDQTEIRRIAAELAGTRDTLESTVQSHDKLQNENKSLRGRLDRSDASNESLRTAINDLRNVLGERTLLEYVFERRGEPRTVGDLRVARALEIIERAMPGRTRDLLKYDRIQHAVGAFPLGTKAQPSPKLVTPDREGHT